MQLIEIPISYPWLGMRLNGLWINRRDGVRTWRSPHWMSLLFLLWFIGLNVGRVQADWPEILGPQRNGHGVLSKDLADHANSPPKLRWEIDAGLGYAGASIQDQQVALFDRKDNSDVLRLVSLEDGKEIWNIAFPATYARGIDADNGPRCVPQLLKDVVLAHSAGGVLHCVNRIDGTKRWSRALRREFGAEDGYFGAGSSPLVVGNTIIVCVGGRKNAGVVAVNLTDGKNLWQSTDADASYSSPILIDSSVRPGLKTVVATTRLATYGLDPRTGNVRWQFPFGQRGPTVNAATPIEVKQGQLFFTASYGIGQLIVKPDPETVRIMNKGDAISSQYATPVAVGDWIFGCDGREDGGSASFRCIDGLEGKLIWSHSVPSICHTIALDPSPAIESPAIESPVIEKKDSTADISPRMLSTNLLILGIRGELWYCPADQEGFKPHWTSALPPGIYRALPAMSENLLVVRTSGGSNSKWCCFEL
ncbi:MAG: PQQ-binding-like beta-propeller repeat protein [Planctomycetota bacterium]